MSLNTHYELRGANSDSPQAFAKRQEKSLESAVEYVPPPRQQGLSGCSLAPWCRLCPATMAPFLAGADTLLEVGASAREIIGLTRSWGDIGHVPGPHARSVAAVLDFPPFPA